MTPLNRASESTGQGGLTELFRTAVLTSVVLGITTLTAQAYVRILTSRGNPIRRTDQANIQFMIQEQVVAGLNNVDGEPWITADSDPRAALNAALDNWDRITQADLRFAAPVETTVGHILDDGNHVFIFEDTPEVRSMLGTALAITWSRFSLSGPIIDSDILFNPKVTVSGQHIPFSTTLEDGTFDLEGVATHEVGHALGANHTHVLAASMFPRTPPASRLQARITDDDIAFVTEVYPAPGAQDARGSISGTVTLSLGGPASGVLLTAVDPNRGVTVGTVSDFDDGTYEIGPLPPGGYRITAEAISGAIGPGDFPPADPAGFNTTVLSAFLGGASNPQNVQVLAGLDALADLSLDEGVSGLQIEFVGVAPPGARLTSMGKSAFPLVAGEVIDLALAGPGIDSTLSSSHLRLLAPGVTVRPGAVGVDPSVTIAGFPIVRATVDVDPRQGHDTGTLAIVKDGEVALFSGGLSIEGSDAPPPPPPTVPAIAPSGVVISNLLPTINAISPNSIISIFGSDFAPPGFVDRNATFDADGLVATNQSGVCVEIDGERAPMFHVQSNQVNAQTPTLDGAALVSAVVITNCDTPEEQRSAPETVQLTDRTPAFLLLEPILNPSDVNPVVASHADFSKVGDPATHPGTTPAEPGEFIILWGTGFGQTDPPLVAGQIPQNVLPNFGLADIPEPFSIAIGGVTFGRPGVFYAGISPQFAGLYQFVVPVPPSLPDGNHEVTAIVGGVSTPPGPFITVKSPP